MEYTTWEVIQMLFANPTLKFKDTRNLDEDTNYICVCDNRICWSNNQERPLYIVVGENALKWILIEEGM